MNQRMVVFPRGINVGGHNKVPMPALRADLAKAGFSDVITLLASGNIIVTTPGDSVSEARGLVREVIASSSGTEVVCVARSAEQMRAIAALNPLGDMADNGSRHLVTFLSARLPAEVAAHVETADFSPNVHLLTGLEMYSWAPEGVSELTLTDRTLMSMGGIVATSRNWNTVEKIVAAL